MKQQSAGKAMEVFKIILNQYSIFLAYDNDNLTTIQNKITSTIMFYFH